jgi:hypothetical protein
MALISMLVIIVGVVTQGFRVPSSDKGGFTTPLLTLNDGVFQAIGVISFGPSSNPSPSSRPNNNQRLSATTTRF